MYIKYYQKKHKWKNILLENEVIFQRETTRLKNEILSIRNLYERPKAPLLVQTDIDMFDFQKILRNSDNLSKFKQIVKIKEYKI